MKYVLGLLFEYKYYKNPANIKIFSNNQLIDEIDLTEDIEIKNMSGNMLLHKNTPLYYWYKKWREDWVRNPTEQHYTSLYLKNNLINTIALKGRVEEGASDEARGHTFGKSHGAWSMDTKEIQIPSKMFIYTLDETVLQNSIKIEITNNNSNYTNGFMTKFSSFVFYDAFLIPTHYLDFKNYKAFLESQTQKKHNLPDYPINDDDNGRPYSLIWPNEHRAVKNGELVTRDDISGNWKKWTKGGSFSIELPIIEYIHEKGLKMLGPINYEQLTKKDKRYLSIDLVCPLYFEYLKLINTQNETT